MKNLTTASPILDALDAHCALLNGSGVIIHVNLAWIQFAEAHGYPAPYGIGEPYLDSWRPNLPGGEGAAEVVDGVRQVLEGRPRFVGRYLCRLGEEPHWFIVRVRRVEGGGVLVAHDPPNWDAARFKTLFATASDGVVLLKRSGRIMDCNDAASRLLGYDDPFALRGLELGLLSAPVQPSGAPGAWATLREATNPEVDWTWRRPDGGTLTTRVVMPPRLPDTDSEPGILLMLRAHEQAPTSEQQLREANLALDQARRAALSMMQDADLGRRQAQRALRELEDSQAQVAAIRAQLESILDAAPSAVLVTLHGKVRYANPRTTELLGLEAGDPTPARIEIESQQERAALLATGEPITNRALELEGADGRELSMLSTMARILVDEEPAVLRILTDTTELQAAERQRQILADRLRLATRAAEIGIWEWDLVRGCFEVDEVLHELFGTTPEVAEDHLQWWLERIHPDDREPLFESIQRGAQHSRVRVIRADGSERVVQGAALLQRDERGRPIRVIGASWDVTDDTRSAQALQSAKEAAEEAMHAKNAFLASMSHEIRTPLNAIVGYSQLLARDQGLGDRQKRLIETVLRSSSHLLTLIDDVLMMAKIDAKGISLALQPCDLRRLLEELHQMFRIEAVKRGLDLRCDLDSSVPEAVSADPGKLRQILINLLSNAFKFTAAGGRVTLRARAEPRASGFDITIAVEDTGCGIPASDLELIFEAFEQSSREGRDAGGTGLGLSISRSFAQTMGGRLDVRSEVGQGSVFTLCWFAEATAVPPVASEERIPTGLAGGETPRVLIVDDIQENRDLLDAYLSSLGFETRLANSGEAAVRAHETWEPELILMDVRMPGIGGLEATRQIRARDRKIPIIAVSAAAREVDREAAADAGMTAFLPKPVRETDLFALLGERLDLEYEYAESSDELSPLDAPPPGLDVEDALARTPAELVRALREAIIVARAEQIQVLLERVRELHPGFARVLGEMAKDYRYEEMLALMGAELAD